MAVPATNTEVHAKFIAELQGQTMHVPDMRAMFLEWPHGGRNKYYRRLKTKLDEMAHSCFADPVKRFRAMRNDFALFTSIWYPEADWDHFYAVGVISFWAFLIDDWMDGNLDQASLDIGASCRFRTEVLAYTRYWLGLKPVPKSAEAIAAPSSRFSWLSPWAFLSKGPEAPHPEPLCPSLLCGTFKEFGQFTQREFSEAFREMFWKELKNYFEHVDIEQRERLDGKLADGYDSYMSIRRYTTAVLVFCYVTQIASGTELPTWLLESEELKKLWEETDVNIIITNDILSIKKELVGCLHNAIPIMYHAGQPLDAIIPDLIAKLATVRDQFDETARRVQELAADCPPKVHRDLDRHIDGLRTIATGTMEWCKIDKRYGLEEYFNNDGTMDIVL